MVGYPERVDVCINYRNDNLHFFLLLPCLLSALVVVVVIVCLVWPNPLVSLREIVQLQAADDATQGDWMGGPEGRALESTMSLSLFLSVYPWTLRELSGLTTCLFVYLLRPWNGRWVERISCIIHLEVVIFLVPRKSPRARPRFVPQTTNGWIWILSLLFVNWIVKQWIIIRHPIITYFDIAN